MTSFDYLKHEATFNSFADVAVAAEKVLKSSFTDKGSVVEIFTDLTVWMGIRKVIDQINANAVA